MKKNKLLVAVITTNIYEYNTDAETEDIAFDEYLNQTGKHFKSVHYSKGTEIHEFKANEPKRRKKK